MIRGGRSLFVSLFVAFSLVAASFCTCPPANASGTLLRLVDALQDWDTGLRNQRLAALFRQKDYATLLDELREASSLFPSAYDANCYDYLKAEALGASGEFRSAAALLVNLSERHKWLAKYALSDAVFWFIKARMWDEAAAAADALRQRGEIDDAYRATCSELAETLFEEGHYEEALKLFQHLDSLFGSDRDAGFAFMADRSLEESGRRKEACRRYLKLVMREEQDDYSAKSLARLLDMQSEDCKIEKALEPAFYLAAGEICLWNHRYSEALDHLRRKALQKGPEPLATKARRVEALCLFKMKDYSEAITHLERLRKGYGDSHDLAWVDTYLGHCYSRLGRHAEAIDRYRAVSEYSTDRRQAAKSAYLLGREMEAAGKQNQAKAVFESIISQYPREGYAADARWRIVLASYSSSDASCREALSGLIELGDKTPYYDDACFLFAKLHETLGDYRTAVERYAENYAEFPNAYFGLVSLDRLAELAKENKLSSQAMQSLADDAFRQATQFRKRGQSGEYLFMLRKAEALSQGSPERLSKAKAQRVTALQAHERTAGLYAPDKALFRSFRLPPDNSECTVRDLASFYISLGMDNKAAEVLRSLTLQRPKDLDLLYATIRTFEDLGKKNDTILLAERVFRRLGDLKLSVTDLPKWFVEALYPLGFSGYVETEAAKHNVEPEIIYAMIREESRFQVSSVSSAAARGVMQIIAPTAKQVAETLGLGQLPIDKLYEPETNISLGVKYLRQLLNQFDERMIFALASYNGGPANVERWLGQCPDDVADDEFINAITFSETRRYAQKVLASYRIYKLLYAEEPHGGSRAKRRTSEAASSESS